MVSRITNGSSDPHMNHPHQQQGLTYIAVLLLVALHGAVLAAAGMVWHTEGQREKERELLFIGEQFRLALHSYAESGPGVVGQLPPTLDDLVLDRRLLSTKRHLRKIFIDPMTGQAQWGILRATDGKSIIGVYSLSHDTPIKVDHFPPTYQHFSSASQYSDWKFQYVPPKKALRIFD